MAGDEDDVIAQRQQFIFDATDQCGVIPLRKISAPDGVLKQYVADKGDATGGVIKDDMAGSMARAVQYGENFIADADMLTLL